MNKPKKHCSYTLFFLSIMIAISCNNDKQTIIERNVDTVNDTLINLVLSTFVSDNEMFLLRESTYKYQSHIINDTLEILLSSFGEHKVTGLYDTLMLKRTIDSLFYTTIILKNKYSIGLISIDSIPISLQDSITMIDWSKFKKEIGGIIDLSPPLKINEDKYIVGCIVYNSKYFYHTIYEINKIDNRWEFNDVKTHVMELLELEVNKENKMLQAHKLVYLGSQSSVNNY